MYLLNLFKVRVLAYEKALIFKHGELKKVLDAGLHWVGPFVKVVKYDITELFYHETDLDLLFSCQDFARSLNVVEVGDNQIALQYKNGNFHQVLTTGRYAYWKEGLELKHVIIDLNSLEVSKNISRKILQKPEVSRYLSVYVVEAYEIGVLHIDGSFVKQLSSGVYYFWKGEQNVIVSKVDTRKQQIEISGQELLTADKASLRISFFASLKVIDVIQAMVESKDFYRQLHVLLQLRLREYIGQFTLDQLLQNKASIGPYILNSAKDKAKELGVDLIDCGIRDIILPGDIKEIMNQVLLAEKKAQANIIMRREETASTRSLLNTAKLMSDNEMLFKLKEMEYMEKFAERVGQITVNGGGRVIDQLRELVCN